jgi:hypothetical protein
LLIGVLVGFWFLVAEGVFFWLILSSARDGSAEYITGEEEADALISWPHYLVLVRDVFVAVAQCASGSR